MNLIKENTKAYQFALQSQFLPGYLAKSFLLLEVAVIAIIAGMVIALFWQPGKTFKPGITFTSKKYFSMQLFLLGLVFNLT